MKIKKLASRIFNVWMLISLSLMIIIIGMSLNFTVIINNHGKMPVKSNYYYIDYLDDFRWMYFQDNNQVKHPLLADQINLYRNMMYSIGDLIMAFGIISLITLLIYQYTLLRKFNRLK